MKILLNTGADGTQYDREIQRAGLAPLVRRLVAQSFELTVIESFDFLEIERILGDQSSFFKEWEDFSESFLLRKVLDLS